MGKPLKNPKWERFCQELESGTDGERAYELAGYAPHRANHVRLAGYPRIIARRAEIRREREAVRIPIADALRDLAGHGFERIADLFEPGASGLVVRDLRAVRVEVALAVIAALSKGFGIDIANTATSAVP